MAKVSDKRKAPRSALKRTTKRRRSVGHLRIRNVNNDRAANDRAAKASEYRAKRKRAAQDQALKAREDAATDIIESTARTKALNMIEVVSEILAFVPKESIGRLAGIARIWRNVMEETPSLYRLPVVESSVLQLPPYLLSIGSLSEKCGHNATMAYRPKDLQARFRFDKYLRSSYQSSAKYVTSNHGRRTMKASPWLSCEATWHTLDLSAEEIAEDSPLRRFRDRFATIPPVPALALEAYCRKTCRATESIVYVKEGVRIGQVLDAARATWISNDAGSSSQKPVPDEFRVTRILVKEYH